MTETTPEAVPVKRHPKKPRIIGTKALKKAARVSGQPLRQFVRDLIRSNSAGDTLTEEYLAVAQKWLAAKSRATGNTSKVARVIPISKAQLESARTAVRKLWGPPPKRGVAVVKKKKAA
jgi:hypothetical protein